MRVLVSTLWLGGAGGSERAVQSALEALSDERVDVVAGTRLGDHPGPERSGGPRVHGPTHWRWRGARAQGRLGRALAAVANPMRRALSPTYDVHIAFPHSHDVAPAARARLRLVIPGGSMASVRTAADVVALEAPDNHRFVPPGARSVLLPPPLTPLAATARSPRVDLPSRFYLTVFNPYAPIKGVDDLRAAAEDAPLPIVWCHSRRTLDFSIPAELEEHPNIVHVPDADPSELRWLYEACRAYLAFSRSEGFGWAAADALQYAPHVVTRPVGLFSFDEAHQQGVHLVSGEWSCDWSRLEAAHDAPLARDVSWLSPDSYVRRLSNLVSGT